MPKTKLKRSTLNTQGFAHYLVPLIVIVGVAVVGTFVLVLKSHNQSNSLAAAASLNHNKSSQTSSLKSGASTTTPLSTTGTSTTSSTPTNSTSKPATTSPKSSPTAAKPPKSTSPTPTTPAQTPLSALIAVITNLYNGTGTTYVTANPVTVAGPITNAKAQPIVYTVNGQTYFAYRQESAPSFNSTPTATANTMATIPATVTGEALTTAYVDKGGNLTDPSFQLVGYSTGGD